MDIAQLPARSAIAILDERTVRDDERLTAVEQQQVKDGNRLTRIETKIAAYAAIGALLGGALVQVAFHL